MLLNEFNRSDAKNEYKSSVRLLESTYGVKIKETDDLHNLFVAASKAGAIMENLRLQNRTIEDKEYSKYALIKEAITSKIDAIYEERVQNLLEFEGIPSVNTGSAKFRRILDATVARAIEQYDSGMDLEDVTRNAVYAFRNTPGIVIPSEIFKIEFEKAFLQKLYFSGREPEMSQAPSYSDTERPAATLLDSITEEELAEALANMEAVIEGKLTEDSDVDQARLQEIAEAIINEGDFYSSKDKKGNAIGKQQADVASKYLDFLGSDLKLDGEEEPIEVKFGKDKAMSPADKAKIARIKKAAAAQK
jgi:hypothetical protein